MEARIREAVPARARRHGLGRELLTLALAKARERAAACVDIEVYAHNLAAIELYRSAGFTVTGPAVTEVRLDGQQWEAVPMSWRTVGD